MWFKKGKKEKNLKNELSQFLKFLKDEEKVNSVLDRFNKSLDKLVDDDNVDTSSVSRDIKSTVIQYWKNTDPKKRTSH